MPLVLVPPFDPSAGLHRQRGRVFSYRVVINELAAELKKDGGARPARPDASLTP
ncbi:MAG: hypothetical protein M3Y79_15335 [Pseudomonadota bacterium]|nr:hypothetical protein [Pseudomonadota bacterium]